eukprot:SAG11_NODE_32564_length_282_cov_1.382514_1_plen_38_part_10
MRRRRIWGSEGGGGDLGGVHKEYDHDPNGEPRANPCMT